MVEYSVAPDQAFKMSDKKRSFRMSLTDSSEASMSMVAASILPTFGLQFLQVDDQPLPVVGANMDVIGIIGPCSTADLNTFPYHTPVLMFSNDLVMLAKLRGTAPEAGGFIDRK